MGTMSVEEYNDLFQKVKAMPIEEQEAWIRAQGGELELAGELDDDEEGQ
jgi:hypothetical protein